MRRRRRREEWPKLLARWQASGESVAEFAARVGVHAMTVCRWQREVKKAAPPALSAALAKIVEVRPARQPADDRFEVRLAGGRCVGVPPSFDDGALARLLRVLEAAA
ncbi:MAG: IS66 family insertion sequence element accessory protein TnpA [Solirubrobacteraceae bacterium]